MKGIITINFKKINGSKLPKEIPPEVITSTNNFMSKLCFQLTKYLEENKIKAKIGFIIDEESGEKEGEDDQ